MTSTFWRGVAANYVSQIYVTLVGIAMVPMYVRYMGTEAYGLVGFFAMLQAWFQLLDMGLTPTMSRQAARYLGGAATALEVRQLMRALERIFIGIAAAGGLGMVLLAPAIATGWLRVEHLPIAEVHQAIALMGVVIALRWVCGLYRSLINGFEHQVWLGHFNMATATARFVLVIPFFLLVGARPAQFFAYQLAVALLETAVVTIKAYRLLPSLPAGMPARTEWRTLKGVLHFALNIAFTGSLWVLVTQTDKLLLSKMLALSDYAYFTLAVLVASGVSIISGPISGVLLPRLSRLHAEGDEHGMLSLYRNATQGVAIVAWTMALMLACFAEPVLRAWTGNAALAERAAPALALYALGNGVLAIGAFPYYLQYAKGNLRLHLRGSLLFVLMLVPAVIVSAQRWGVEGAGWAWLGANLAYLLCWVPLVHRAFAPGLHIQWLRRDVIGVVGLPSAVGMVASHAGLLPSDRMLLAITLVLVGGWILGVAAVSSSMGRQWIQRSLLQLAATRRAARTSKT